MNGTFLRCWNEMATRGIPMFRPYGYPHFVPSGTRESSGGGDRLLSMFHPYGYPHFVPTGLGNHLGLSVTTHFSSLWDSR